jgi:two-component system sensor histidine kinase AgrC
MASFHILIASKMLNENIDFKNKRVVLGLLVLIILVPIMFIFFDDYIRVVLDFIIIAVSLKLIFNADNQKTLFLTCIIFLFYFLAEILFMGILMTILHIDAKSLITNWKGRFWTDGLISLIALGISLTPPVKNICVDLLNVKIKYQFSQVILCVVFGIAVFGTKNGLTYGFNLEYFANLLLIVVFLLIVFYLFKEKRYSTEISEKYEQLIKYIEKYEKELTKKSMLVHEFKNQIISIKGFVNKKNKALTEYLNSIASDINKNESETIRNMENLPKGGLKGLIYYKLGYLEEENINISFDISKSMKKSPFSRIDSKLYNDILKVIGIYLDNAIESAKTSVNKKIALEIYYNKSIFNFILSNTYDNTLRTDKLGKAGYSTKGKGRGYGLLLSKSIVDKNECMQSKTEISGEYFTQYLTIDFKNIPKK